MRDRAWRRAQTQRYKAKQYRDVAKLAGRDEAERRAENGLSDTRHTLDCGRRCFACSGAKLLYGRRSERYAAKQEINKEQL